MGAGLSIEFRSFRSIIVFMLWIPSSSSSRMYIHLGFCIFLISGIRKIQILSDSWERVAKIEHNFMNVFQLSYKSELARVCLCSVKWSEDNLSHLVGIDEWMNFVKIIVIRNKSVFCGKWHCILITIIINSNKHWIVSFKLLTTIKCPRSIDSMWFA